jgi:Protein of unknown function (DUF3237)
MISRRTMMGSALLAACGSAVAATESKPAEHVGSRFVFQANVSVATPLVIGPATIGLRRVVPITGGTVAGPRFNGRVVPGGADWQVVRPDGVLQIEAKYTLESHDGILVMVTNRGMRHGPAAVIEKLTRGEPVDPSEYYFRTVAEFEAPTQSPYAWLNRAMFVGVAERQASAAIVRFYEVL